MSIAADQKKKRQNATEKNAGIFRLAILLLVWIVAVLAAPLYIQLLLEGSEPEIRIGDEAAETLIEREKAFFEQTGNIALETAELGLSGSRVVNGFDVTYRMLNVPDKRFCFVVEVAKDAKTNLLYCERIGKTIQEETSWNGR